jgi:hypothetical protein
MCGKKIMCLELVVIEIMHRIMITNINTIDARYNTEVVSPQKFTHCRCQFHN